MEMAVVRPIKFKRRKVSAVRDFPRGCGPLSVGPVSPKLPIGSPDLPNGLLEKFDGASRNDGPDGMHAAGPPPATTLVMLIPDQSELPKEGCGQSSDQPGLPKLNIDQPELPNGNSDQPELPNVKSDQLELLKDNSCQMALLKGSSDQPEQLGAVKTVDLNSYHLSSRSYPPPKRRKVSAVRDYPVGCGRASQSIKEGILEVAPLAPVKCKSLNAEKAHAVNQHQSIESSAEFKHTLMDPTEVKKVETKQTREVLHDGEGRMKLTSACVKSKNSDGEKKLATEQTQVLHDNDAACVKSKNSDGEKKLATEQTQVLHDNDGEGRIKLPSACVMSKNSDGEKKLATKQTREVLHDNDGEGRIKLPSDGEKKLATKQTREVLHDYDEGRIKLPSASVKSKNSDGEKKLATKQQSKNSDGEKKLATQQQSKNSESLIRAASFENSHGEAKRNDVKQVREMTQEISNGARLKYSSKSCPGETVVEECSNLKILARSDSKKKFEGHDSKQLTESFAIEKTSSSKSSPDSRYLPGIKFRIKTGNSVVGKPHLKVLVKHPGDSKDLKRKFKEEVEDDQTEAGGSLEACDDKIVVQALMASPSCPWRQGGKSGVITDRSVTPIKVKKFRKSLTKNSGMKGASSVSRLKDEVASGGEEDYTPTAEESGQALVIYKKPREVTLTPLVPPRPNNRSDNEVVSDRNKVKRVLRLFQVASRKLLQEQESRPKAQQKRRVDLIVSTQLKERGLWVNYDGSGTIGHVPGVEVGDEFHYRVELSIVGLHRPFQGGIDYMKKNGRVLATSIVASGGYKDDMDNSDVLIYHGSGGSPAVGGKPAVDQKLERGNLGLKNSIDAKSPVRVIHGFKELKGSHRDAKAKAVSTFTYDGLYVVEEYREEMGPEGFSVFKFQLRRMAGQPELALKEAKRSKKARVREGLCIEDISGGKETLPICAVNTIDDDRPMPFNYITENIYPSSYAHIPPSGCNCTHGCSESSVADKCACAIKNAGEIPFNNDGAIVEARPLVYECGPSCRCPPSCYNRVSQHGIQIRLELFKTKSMGWGVRSLDSIPSGTFICEYIGEMLQDSEAELRSNDQYLFDIGHNYEDPSLWEGFRSFTPSLQSSSICKTMEELGFTIDAAEYGNIGRFINHSCSPNIYAQNVLYDHDDKRMPHIMFFAADNIPPLQELTYHYNYSIDQVRDSEGNIKRKTCHCGSPDCTGRLY